MCHETPVLALMIHTAKRVLEMGVKALIYSQRSTFFFLRLGDKTNLEIPEQHYTVKTHPDTTQTNAVAFLLNSKK